MRQVPRIKSAYDWMIASYDAAVASAAAHDPAAITRLDASRETLERGVFVLLFAQFEIVVSEHFEQALAARSANPDWTVRRGWDVPSLQGRRIPFETKLALVMDRRDGHHARILAAYGLRNHCAHGGTTEPVGSIDDVVADLYVWQGLLHH